MSGAATAAATPLGKVTEMLQEMKERSEELQQDESTAHAQLQQSCEEITQTKTAEIEALDLQIESMQADIGEADTGVRDLGEQIIDLDRSVTADSVQLEELRHNHTTQQTEFTRQLTEYTLAIDAVERAIDILSQAAASKGKSLLEKWHSIALTVVGHVRAVREFHRYVPDDGGMEKDEHIFDNFEDLSTATSEYESGSASSGIIGVLQDVLTNFQEAKTGLLAEQQVGHNTFEDMQTSLLSQLESSREEQTTSRGRVADTQESLATMRAQLVDTNRNRNSTAAFLVRVEATCAQKNDDFERMKEFRAGEVAALEKALELITGSPPEAIGKTGVFLRLRSVTVAGGFAAGLETPLDEADKVIGFLRFESHKLSSESMGQLVSRMSASVTQDPDSRQKEDPLAKVKTMIEDLIVELQQQSAEESEHKAYCDGELTKNERAQKSAKGDIKRYETETEQIQGDYALLEEQVADLNRTLNATSIQRETLVEERQREHDENNATIEDAVASAEAVEAAMSIITEFYANASKAIALVQVRSTFPRFPAAVKSIVPVRALVRSTIAGQGRVVSAATMASQSIQRRGKPEAKEEPHEQTANEMPDGMATAQHSGPLAAEGNNVVHLLEVVRDDYREIAAEATQRESKAQRQYTDTMQQLAIMNVSMTKDRDFRTSEMHRLDEELPEAQTSLNMSLEALRDAEATFEGLKAPCLQQETYEERAARRQAEIEALQSAEKMLEDFSAQLSGMSLAQVGRSQRARAEAQRLGLVSMVSKSNLEGLSSEDSKDDPSQLEKVAELLRGIKSEVAADLADDTQVYHDMQSWCTETIGDKTTELAEANDRERELMTEIESSTQQKAQLTSEIEFAEKDLAEQQEKLDELSGLRAREREEFNLNEKQLLESIQALRNAIIVLERRYEPDDPRDLAAERQEIQDAQLVAGKSLVAVASDISQAFKALPSSLLTSGVSAAEDSPALREFLATPERVMQLPWRRASLAETAARGGEPSGTGEEIFGILKQLKETFEQDLASARATEEHAVEDFESVSGAKVTTVETLTESIELKKSQLVHATTTHAEAKEDLANLRASYTADRQYLMASQEQCLDTEHEFAIRNKTRHDEIAALNHAVDILTAGGAKGDGTAVASGGKDDASNLLLHSRKQAHQISQRSRVVSKVHVGTANQKAKQPVAHSKAKPIKPESVVDMFLHHHQPKPAKPKAVQKLQTAKPERKQEHRLAVLRALALSPGTKAETLGPLAAGGVSAMARRTLLAAISMGSRQAPSFSTSGQTGDALSGAVIHIDRMNSNLAEEKQQEIDMKDTCVREENAATMQKERRLTDQSKLNTTIQRLEAQISDLTTQIDRIDEDISAMNASLAVAHDRRIEEYNEFRQAVNEQEESQKVLREAQESLKSFYKSGNMALLQSSATVPHRKQPVSAEPAAHAQAMKAFVRAFAATTSQGSAKRSPPGVNASRLPSSTIPVVHALVHAVHKQHQKPSESSESGRTERPRGFSKPNKPHEANQGVMGILQLLIEDSESLVESIVEAEETARKAYSADLTMTQHSMEEKDRELVSLEATRGDAEAELNDANSAKNAVTVEIFEIVKFLGIINDRCSFLLANFDKSQEARQKELDNLKEAKRVLSGMQPSFLTFGTQRAAKMLRGSH